MASFKNDFGLSGKLGDVIIYRMGNKSYARRTFRANNPNKTTGSEGEILSCNPVLPEVERDFVKKNIEGVCSRKQFQWLYVLS